MLAKKIARRFIESSTVVDTKLYEQDFRKKLEDLIAWSLGKQQQISQKQFDVKALERRVQEALGSQGLSLFHTNLSKLQSLLLENIDWLDLWSDVREYARSQEGLETEEELREPSERSFREVVQATRGEAKRVEKLIQGALKRIPAGRPKVNITIQPRLPEDFFEPAGAFSVFVGPMRNNLMFSLFLDGSRVEVDDVLEGGDIDFFKGKPEEAVYFDLINELRKPGSTSKGKVITLWTARPRKDRSKYERAREVPGGIFLTNSRERALGIARDFGERDLWRVRINTKYLVKTLDTGRVKDFQVVGNNKVPAQLFLE